MCKWLAVVTHPLCPNLRWDHALLRSNGRHEVLLRQEVQRKLDQEASDFAQLFLSTAQVSLGQTWFGLVLLQLGHVPHQGRRKATKHLQQKHIFAVNILLSLTEAMVFSHSCGWQCQ